ncbi:MAG: hypothetical protein GVY33_08315 [Alphaproteobacteria bacterium]|nr:hypothetical protein [Alphaproteobacteria bacterium]
MAALEGCARIPVAVAGYAEPSNVFNLGTTTVLGTGGRAAEHLLAHPRCGVAVVAGSARPAFDDAVAEADARTRSLGTVAGINVSKGERLTLELVTLAASDVVAPPPAQGAAASAARP